MSLEIWEKSVGDFFCVSVFVFAVYVIPMSKAGGETLALLTMGKIQFPLW